LSGGGTLLSDFFLDRPVPVIPARIDQDVWFIVDQILNQFDVDKKT
jgi:hypothetical protein